MRMLRVTRDLAEVDLTDLDTFANGFPHELFRAHREIAPVWWHEPTDHTPDGEGFGRSPRTTKCYKCSMTL